MEVKNFHFYNRRDNLWDDTTHLAPSVAKYSADNVSPNSFKKTIVNLSHVADVEREDQFGARFKKLLTTRTDGLQRHSHRVMERLIN